MVEFGGQVLVYLRLGGMSCIQEKNCNFIFDVVFQEFFKFGFLGVIVECIVVEVGMLKFNLFYYFFFKEMIYIVVFVYILDVWLVLLKIFDLVGDFVWELSVYICQKIEILVMFLEVFRLFVNEVMQGVLQIFLILEIDLKCFVLEKVKVIEDWIVVGKM